MQYPMRYAVFRARKNANAHPDGSGQEVPSVGHSLPVHWVSEGRSDDENTYYRRFRSDWYGVDA